ncbi:hypothetical protein O9G_001732 [Rozella allomycis CSF55]|uniref:L domain-like protein n=1 Tax=Rozella allomycis (strain CSF55) TaxID=988480 RepID=A0A075AT19_ROZAC|nr:hypothetical protein O9G_001732 [Rozella allomycis CSF55]|eukprot:EPZ33320.1 hypothetical protein O9G_001732 [Rozella allomycis CSF55]
MNKLKSIFTGHSRKKEKNENGRVIDFSFKKLFEYPYDSIIVIEPEEIGTLKLDHNFITTLPQDILDLRKLHSIFLKFIDLSSNKLRDLSDCGFEHLDFLTSLNLTNNQLESVPLSLFKCHKLKHLGLAHNLLKRIPEEIVNLCNLEMLTLNDNNILEISKCLRSLRRLESITLYGNKFNEALQFVYLPQSLKYCVTSVPFSDTFNPCSEFLNSLDLRDAHKNSLEKSLSNLSISDESLENVCSIPPPISKHAADFCTSPTKSPNVCQLCGDYIYPENEMSEELNKIEQIENSEMQDSQEKWHKFCYEVWNTSINV